MTEDIRDAAPGTPGNGEPAPEPAPGAAPPVPAEDVDPFVAGAMNAETLARPKEPDYKDRWLRAEAEIQNVRRRAQRDREEAVRASEDRILIDMIEVLDDLERALAAASKDAGDAGDAGAGAWAQGVALTAQRLRDALARRGVTPIATVGQRFDPAFHEALLEVDAPEGIRPGDVAQEVLKGYARDNRALRAARVVVARMEG